MQFRFDMDGIAMTKDQNTLACVNLFGVFGAIPKLCEVLPEARQLIAGKKVSIGFDIKNVTSATLAFDNGSCKLTQATEDADILLPFSTAEKFNRMIDGSYTPIPRKGFTKISFLTGAFMKLTDLLSKYLRPSEDELADDVFFEKSTLIMLHLIRGAVAAVGNYDSVGKCSAGYIVDGVIKLSIAGSEAVAVSAKDHRLTPMLQAPEKYMSCMEFDDIRLARALFDGKVNAMVCVGEGKIRVSGMISQVDNVNRILDRVSFYLA